MRVEDVEIHVGDLDRPYRTLGDVKATERAPTIFNNAPNIDGVHSKLREKAVGLGGNAVVNVTYRRGIGLISWKELTAKGTAVFVEAAVIRPAMADVRDQLQRLGDLRDRGVLTVDEFEKLKTDLLVRV